MHLFLSLLYAFGFSSSFAAGWLHLKSQDGAGTPPTKQFTAGSWLPVATLLLTATIAVPSFLQSFSPAVLPLLRRDSGAIMNGDWWRVGTALLVQDGGITGSLINLVALLLVGSVSERLWGAARMLGIFVAGGVLSECVALAWQPIGAGNSVGNFALAGSLASFCLIRPTVGGERLHSCVTLGIGVLLLTVRDIHGAAIGFGAVLGLALIEHGRRSPSIKG